MRSRRGATGDLVRFVVVEARELCAHGVGEARHFLEVQFGERLEAASAVFGERETDGASMFGIGCASDEAFRFGAVDEADGAVVAKQEVAGDVPDRWAGFVRVALDR